MKPSTVSFNAAILLSALAYLTGIARLMLDMRFVPEVFNAMPEDQPGQTALVMLFFLAIYGGWLWALLAAVRKGRRGLITLLVFNLLLAFGWGLATAVALCPTPCEVAVPLTDIVAWSNVIVGLVAAGTVGAYLRTTTI